MPAYRFEALQTNGSTRKGTLEADSLKTARTQLRAQSLVPLMVEAIASGSGSDADAKAELPPLRPDDPAFLAYQTLHGHRLLHQHMVHQQHDAPMGFLQHPGRWFGKRHVLEKTFQQRKGGLCCHSPPIIP